MSQNTNRVEPHGCIVCGKIHNLLVVYTSSGKMFGCTATSPDSRVVPDELRPLVACNTHSKEEVDDALEKHYPGKGQPEDKEE
jgi:hypothetical protein